MRGEEGAERRGRRRGGKEGGWKGKRGGKEEGGREREGGERRVLKLKLCTKRPVGKILECNPDIHYEKLLSIVILL